MNNSRMNKKSSCWHHRYQKDILSTLCYKFSNMGKWTKCLKFSTKFFGLLGSLPPASGPKSLLGSQSVPQKDPQSWVSWFIRIPSKNNQNLLGHKQIHLSQKFHFNFNSRPRMILATMESNFLHKAVAI